MNYTGDLFIVVRLVLNYSHFLNELYYCATDSLNRTPQVLNSVSPSRLVALAKLELSLPDYLPI